MNIQESESKLAKVVRWLKWIAAVLIIAVIIRFATNNIDAIKNILAFFGIIDKEEDTEVGFGEISKIEDRSEKTKRTKEFLTEIKKKYGL